MSKIRKGSIVYHTRLKCLAKALTSSEHGELTDKLTEKTGKKFHPHFKGYVLLQKDESAENVTYNNIPCFYARTSELIPRKEYLEIQKELAIKYN